MAHAGFPQHHVEQMELWVIAKILGVNDEPATPADGGPGVELTPEEFERRSRQQIIDRVERARAAAAKEADLPHGDPADVGS